jgi:hypothetical protein
MTPEPSAILGAVKSRIMYIEHKADVSGGKARIGRVFFSKRGKTLRYGGKSFQSLRGRGFKANYFEVGSGQEYWISGCKRDGSDRLYGERVPVEIDDDVRVEYWTKVRELPENAAKTTV